MDEKIYSDFCPLSLEILKDSNIWSQSYYKISLSIFNEQCDSRYNACINHISNVNIYLNKSMCGLFSEVTTISDEYKYLNKMALKYY